MRKTSDAAIHAVTRALIGDRIPRTLVGATALAALAVLGLDLQPHTTPLQTPGRIAFTEVATFIPAPADLTSEQQTLLKLLPAGYSEGSCQPATLPAPDPNALAALDCSQNAQPGGPTLARYQLFANRDALNAAFQTDTSNTPLQSCPGGLPSPGTWGPSNESNTNAGQVLCGTFTNPPFPNNAAVGWTKNSTLVLGDAQGPDLVSLYQWWQQHR